MSGATGTAEAWERDLAVWLGLAGAVSESSDSSSEDEEGRSPGAVAFWDLRLMAASFLALASARRCSRVRAGAEGSSSEEDSSEESSSSEEDSAFGSRGSLGLAVRGGWVFWRVAGDLLPTCPQDCHLHREGSGSC